MIVALLRIVANLAGRIRRESSDLLQTCKSRSVKNHLLLKTQQGSEVKIETITFSRENFSDLQA